MCSPKDIYFQSQWKNREWIDSPAINNWEIGHEIRNNSFQTLDDRQIRLGTPERGDKAGLWLSGRHIADSGEGGGSLTEFRGLSKLRTQKYVFREAED